MGSWIFRRSSSTTTTTHCNRVFNVLPTDKAVLFVLALGLASLVYISSFYRDIYGDSADGGALTGSSVAKNSTRGRRDNQGHLASSDSSYNAELPGHSTLTEQLRKPTLMFMVNQSADPEREATSWYSPKLCRRDQIINGQWVPEHLTEPPYRPTVVHLRCYPRDTYYSKDGWDTHTWVPNDEADDDCDFGKWRKEMYCSVAKYATVMIAGDSLSWEHYASLVQLLGVKTRQGYQHMSRELGMTIGQAVCGGKSRVVYRRDDRLTRLRDALLDSSENNTSAIPQVLVLNRGAHYANDTEFMNNLNLNLDVVEEWQDRCDELGIKCHFFWRTTVPGHPNCWNDTTPATNKAEIEARIADITLYDEKKINYHWYDFQHQNLLAEAELRRRGMPHRILDAYHLNVLRPDEHRAHQNDCLHSCYPGKMDVYSRLLLHYLRIDRTSADVDVLKSVVKEQKWNVNVTTEYDKDATREAAAIRVAAGGRLPDDLYHSWRSCAGRPSWPPRRTNQGVTDSCLHAGKTCKRNDACCSGECTNGLCTSGLSSTPSNQNKTLVDGTICGPDTTCKQCVNPATYWPSKAGTACGNEPCWEDGTVCIPASNCKQCCNPARDALGNKCGGAAWPDGTLCRLGTTCNTCQNEATVWPSKAFTACGSEPKWEDGTRCQDTECASMCMNPATLWFSKKLMACGSEPCWGSGSYCLGGALCQKCCNGSSWRMSWTEVGYYCN